MPRKQIVIQQGATFSFSFQVLDETAEGCVPRDLDGWTARMQVRPSFESSEVALSLDSTDGITITPAEGRVLLTATPTQTSAIAAPAAYVYDVEGVSADGSVVERWLEGVARVTAEVTR